LRQHPALAPVPIAHADGYDWLTKALVSCALIVTGWQGGTYLIGHRLLSGHRPVTILVTELNPFVFCLVTMVTYFLYRDLKENDQYLDYKEIYTGYGF
jgi:hypothetical protein